MSEMLARCGYRCDLCAAQSPNASIRLHMVKGWRKFYGHTRYTVDNVQCDGCRCDNGRLADINCQVRPCVIEKGISTCAHCDEMPCDKLQTHLTCRGRQMKRLQGISQEDYNLCCRQFDSIPRLLKIRNELGLPDNGLVEMMYEDPTAS